MKERISKIFIAAIILTLLFEVSAQFLKGTSYTAVARQIETYYRFRNMVDILGDKDKDMYPLLFSKGTVGPISGHQYGTKERLLRIYVDNLASGIKDPEFARFTIRNKETYVLQVYSGTRFKVCRYDYSSNYRTVLFAKGNNKFDAFETHTEDNDEIVLTTEKINDLKKKYGKNVEIYMELQYNETIKTTDNRIGPRILIEVKPNKIKIGERILPLKGEEKAVIYKNTLYIPKGHTVSITNEAKPGLERDYQELLYGLRKSLTVDGNSNSFVCNSNLMQVQAVGKVGNSGILKYDCSITQAQIPIKISNMSGSSFKVTGSSVENGKTYNGCPASQSIGVDLKSAEDPVIYITPTAAFKGIKAVADENSLFVYNADKSVSTIYKPVVEPIENYYKVTLKNKKEGYIAIDTYNYKAEVHREYVYVYNSSKPKVVKPSPATNPIGQDTVEPDTNNTQPTLGQPIYNNPTPSYNEPTITPINERTEYRDDGKVIYAYSVKDCDKVKVKFIKRSKDDEPTKYNFSKQGYDSLNWTEYIPQKGEVEIFLDPYNNGGEGIYDLYMCLHNGSRYRHLGWEHVVAVSKPIICTQVKESTSEKITLKVQAKSLRDTHITSAKCTIYKSATLDKKGTSVYEGYINSTNTSTKKSDYGLKTEAEFTIDLNDEKYTAGYYTFEITAKNKYGRTTTETKRVTLSNRPEFNNNTYTIEGEDPGVVSTNTARNEQKIVFDIVDKDVDDSIKVMYRVSNRELDISQLDKYQVNSSEGWRFSMFFADPNNSKTYTKDAKGGDHITISIPADHNDKDTMKYIYIGLVDKYGNPYIMPTGAIKFSYEPLQIKKIEVVNSDKNKKAYKVNDKFKVRLYFNYDIRTENTLPDLYMNFGGYDRKQDEDGIELSEKNGNEITYVYTVDENCQDGEIKIGKLDGKFYDKNVVKKMFGGLPESQALSKLDQTESGALIYNKQITEDLGNIVDKLTGNYTVDITSPSVESIEVQIEADAEEMNEKKYISNINKANVHIKYNEEITGQTGILQFKKGTTTFNANDDIKEKSDESNISIKETIIENTSDFEGSIEFVKSLNDNSEDCAVDDAGNKLVFKDENIKNNIKYKLNDVEVDPKTVIFDATVLKPRLCIENEEVTEDGTYKTGTTFTGFAEFNKEANCKDASGIQTVKLELESDNEVEIKDVNNTVINPNSINNGKSIYNLNTEQLPINFTINEEGTYKINAIKEDNLNNPTKNEITIRIKDEIKINTENSKVILVPNVDEKSDKVILPDGSKVELDSKDTPYSVVTNPTNILMAGKVVGEGDSKKYSSIRYNLRLELSNLKAEDIRVFFEYRSNLSKKETDDKPYIYKEATLVDQRTEDNNVTYADYRFGLNRGGEYNILVVKVEDDNDFDIDNVNNFHDKVMIENVFIPGDLNGDGRAYQTTDLTAMLKYLAGIFGESTYHYYASNVLNGPDEDGNLYPYSGSIFDAVALARAVAELPGYLPNEYGYLE